MAHRFAVALACLAFAAPVAAQVPAGAEFQVDGGAIGPAVAADASGNFVIAWVTPARYQHPFETSEVRARLFDAAGATLKPTFTVNDADWTLLRQAGRVASASGGFVVVWRAIRSEIPIESLGRSGGDGDSFWFEGSTAKRHDASGIARGNDFRAVSSIRLGPDVASDAFGNFVVVGDDLVAQRWGSSGAPRGSEFLVDGETTSCRQASVASSAAGDFVVAWKRWSPAGGDDAVWGRRYDALGVPQGPAFLVNARTPAAYRPSVAVDAAGNSVIVWTSEDQDGSGAGILGRRYDAAGVPQGPEFRVNTYTTGEQTAPAVASDAGGNFVVVWGSNAGSSPGLFAQRFDAAGTLRGHEFQVSSSTITAPGWPTVASDAVGNLVFAWGDYPRALARRFGGIVPAANAVDTAASPNSDGNGVLEAGESVDVRPSWRNVNGLTQSFDGGASSFHGPSASGVGYQLLDGVGAYGTVANGATAVCSDCYQVGVTFAGVRPATHWDATLSERLTPDALGQTKLWPVHVGESFTDVPKTSLYYPFVETLLHRGVSGGCAADRYCPASSTTREQMAAFVLLAKEGQGYVPTPCSPPTLFADVPETSMFCDVIEELARRGVVSGCGDGNYCPASAVSRAQISVFLLRVLDPALDPPACTTPAFDDVPASSPFCRWIEELARRGVVGGCGGGNYCPTSPVTREQMAVFVTGTFGLSLYGP